MSFDENLNIFSIGLQKESIIVSHKYKALTVKIERFSKLVYIALAKVTVLAKAIPPFLISMIKYFIYDMNDESFQDLFLMYVIQRYSREDFECILLYFQDAIRLENANWI